MTGTTEYFTTSKKIDINCSVWLLSVYFVQSGVQWELLENVQIE